MKKSLYYIIPFLLIVLVCVVLAGGEVKASEGQQDPAQEYQPKLVPVEVTAYYDYMYHLGIGKDGRPLVEGLTIAGPEEWLGYTVALYDLEYSLIGLYEVRDIGYGKSLGWEYGASKLRKGSPKGDIEAGKTLDLYFNSKQDCLNWGRRRCYMQLIKSEG